MELRVSVLCDITKEKYYILLSSAHTKVSKFSEFYAGNNPTDKSGTSPFASPDCETNFKP